MLIVAETGLAAADTKTFHWRATVAEWQRRLTPFWSKVSGGCHLDRPIQALIAQADFDRTHLKTGYMKGPKPMTYMYEGRAVPK